MRYVVAAAAVALVALGSLAVRSLQPEPGGSTPAPIGDISGGGEPVPAPHSVSLPAMFTRAFDGSNFSVGRVLAQEDAYTRYFITYHSGGLTISGIMNVPRGDGPFPVLILNHGYIDPAVYTNGRGLRREQDYLVRRGYVIVHPDYRNHAQSDLDASSTLKLRLDYAEDAINAVLALRAASLPYVDGNRVGMLGHSMGGGVTLNTLVAQPALVKAAVLFAPVSADYVDNFNRWTRGTSTPAASRSRQQDQIVAAYGSPESSPDFWRNVSAISFFDRVGAPVLIHHGTADESVPLEWSERTAAALEASGKEVELQVYPGQPHEFTSAWPTVMERTAAFFDRYLK